MRAERLWARGRKRSQEVGEHDVRDEQEGLAADTCGGIVKGSGREGGQGLHGECELLFCERDRIQHEIEEMGGKENTLVPRQRVNVAESTVIKEDIGHAGECQQRGLANIGRVEGGIEGWMMKPVKYHAILRGSKCEVESVSGFGGETAGIDLAGGGGVKKAEEGVETRRLHVQEEEAARWMGTMARRGRGETGARRRGSKCQWHKGRRQRGRHGGLAR